MDRKTLFVWDFFGVLTEQPGEAGLVMGKVKEERGTNIIVSNTPSESIREFLAKEKFSDKVDEIISSIGRGKADVLKEYLKGSRPSKIVAIGDNLEDIEAGEAVSAITYGYRNPNLEQRADFLINNLIELLDEVKE